MVRAPDCAEVRAWIWFAVNPRMAEVVRAAKSTTSIWLITAVDSTATCDELSAAACAVDSATMSSLLRPARLPVASAATCAVVSALT